MKTFLKRFADGFNYGVPFGFMFDLGVCMALCFLIDNFMSVGVFK